MCACHDPLVFGHRCKDEPCGDIYASITEAQVTELDRSLTAMINALSTLNLKLTA